MDSIKFEPGNLCMVTGGRNTGRVGTIIHRERHPGSFDIVHVKVMKSGFVTSVVAIWARENGALLLWVFRSRFALSKENLTLLFYRVLFAAFVPLQWTKCGRAHLLQLTPGRFQEFAKLEQISFSGVIFFVYWQLPMCCQTYSRETVLVHIVLSFSDRLGIVQSLNVIFCFQDANGHTFATRLGYIFVIGKGTKPYISLPRGNGIKLTIAEERDKRMAGKS